jgi:lactoylglutathione lyase
MADRAFPVLFSDDVSTTAAFYEDLGFARHFQLPLEGDPGYVGLRRGSHEIAVVSSDWPQTEYGATVGGGVRFEMFIYVDDLDRVVERLQARGTSILREPMDMPWGERIAYVTDPEGNPVGLALAGPPTLP